MSVDFKLRVLYRAVIAVPLAMLAADVVAQSELARADAPVAIAVGKHPAGIAFGPDGKHLYVTSNGDNSVASIDVAAVIVGQPGARGNRAGTLPGSLNRPTGQVPVAAATTSENAVEANARQP